MMDSQTSLLYNKSLRFLSFRPRSVYEMKAYLQKNKAENNQIEVITQKLIELNFLNDREFAEKWIEDRKKFHPKSLTIIKFELLQKGISKEIIDEVLSKQKEEGEDLRMAKNLLTKQLPKHSGLSPRDLRIKLSLYLQRKGFSWEIVKTAIDDCLEKE